MSQLTELAKPFPAKLVKKNPTGYGDYVAHHVVAQRLLQVLGGYDLELVEIVRGWVPESGQKPALDNAVVGVVMRLTVTVDGERRVAEEAGDCENPQNWQNDGARLKDATSDAFKRCAMRLGCGLHLWSQGDYYLHERLKDAEKGTDAA